MKNTPITRLMADNSQLEAEYSSVKAAIIGFDEGDDLDDAPNFSLELDSLAVISTKGGANDGAE